MSVDLDPSQVVACRDLDRAYSAIVLGHESGARRWLNHCAAALGWDVPFPADGMPFVYRELASTEEP